LRATQLLVLRVNAAAFYNLHTPLLKVQSSKFRVGYEKVHSIGIHTKQVADQGQCNEEGGTL